MGGGVFQIKNTYALENEDILAGKVNFYIEETQKICTSYRYTNYTGIIKLLGYTFSKGTGEHGGWWSSFKPYGLDQPIEEY